MSVTKPLSSKDDVITFPRAEAFVGRLECSLCGEDAWCSHRSEYILERQDTWLFWTSEPDGSLPERLVVDVPIIPTYPWDTWVVTILVRQENSSIYSVYPERASEPMDQFKDWFVGFLCEGEGLITLREMLMDYARSSPGFDDNQCRCSAHNLSAQTLYKKHKSDGGVAFLAQKLCIWNTGMCLFCRDARANPEDINDLIPESTEPRRGRRWPR